MPHPLTKEEQHAIEVVTKAFYQRTGHFLEAVFMFYGTGKEPRFEVYQYKPEPEDTHALNV